MKTMNSFKPSIAAEIRMVIGSILLLSAFLLSKSFAQQPSRQSETAFLEKFTGYYQLPNKSAFILFELRENVLFATQLWDDKEYQLVQINETNFETKEGGHKVEFLDENSDGFTHAKILEKITTVKVAFNPEIVMQLSAAQRKGLEGTYTFTEDSKFKLEIRSSTNGLILKQLWDNKEINFTPRSETFFLSDDNTFPLTFLLNDGEVAQLTCFESDIWLKEE